MMRKPLITPSQSIKNPAPYRAPLYEFCLIPQSGRGNNSEKYGNSPGIIQGFTAGICEVICSNVTIASGWSTRAFAKLLYPGGDSFAQESVIE